MISNTQNNTENLNNGKVTLEESNAWMDRFYSENSRMVEYLSDNLVDHPALHSLIRYLIMQVKREYPKVKPEVLSDILTERILNTGAFSFTEDVEFASRFRNWISGGFRPKIYDYKGDPASENTINLFERNHSFDLAEYVTSLIYNKAKSKENLKEWWDQKRYDAVPKQAFEFSTIAHLRFACNREFWFGGRVDKAYINRNSYGYEYASIFINAYGGNSFKAYVPPKHFLNVSNGIRKLRFNHDNIVIHGEVKKQHGSEEIILHADKFTSYRYNTIRSFS